MSPWVLPERPLGTVRYTETYPDLPYASKKSDMAMVSDMPDRTLFTLHRTLTVPVPSTTYVAIFEIHMYRPPSFISL